MNPHLQTIEICTLLDNYFIAGVSFVSDCLSVSKRPHVPGRSLEFPADADVDLHGLQRPLLLWFDALKKDIDD